MQLIKKKSKDISTKFSIISIFSIYNFSFFKKEINKVVLIKTETIIIVLGQILKEKIFFLVQLMGFI